MIEKAHLQTLGWNTVQLNARSVARSEFDLRRQGIGQLGIRTLIEQISTSRQGWEHPDIFYFVQAATTESRALAPARMLQHSVSDIAGVALSDGVPARELPRITSNGEHYCVTSHALPTPSVLDIWQSQSLDPVTKRNAFGNVPSHIGFVGHIAAHPDSIVAGSIPRFSDEPTIYYAELDAHMGVPHDTSLLL